MAGGSRGGPPERFVALLRQTASRVPQCNWRWVIIARRALRGSGQRTHRAQLWHRPVTHSRLRHVALASQRQQASLRGLDAGPRPGERRGSALGPCASPPHQASQDTTAQDLAGSARRNRGGARRGEERGGAGGASGPGEEEGRQMAEQGATRRWDGGGGMVLRISTNSCCFVTRRIANGHD